MHARDFSTGLVAHLCSVASGEFPFRGLASLISGARLERRKEVGAIQTLRFLFIDRAGHAVLLTNSRQARLDSSTPPVNPPRGDTWLTAGAEGRHCLLRAALVVLEGSLWNRTM